MKFFLQTLSTFYPSVMYLSLWEFVGLEGFKPHDMQTKNLILNYPAAQKLTTVKHNSQIQANNFFFL